MAVKKVKSILLVDDDPVANYLHFNLLDSLYIAEKIDIVTNGEEAFNFIKKFGEPDIIHLDLHMPVMDGILFLQNFRKSSSLPKAQIFILTSSDHEKDISDCKNWGINGYILKPLTEQKIQEQLIIDHFSSHEQEDFIM